MTDLEIRRLGYLEPDARGLVAAALADLGERYGGDGDSSPVDPADFDPPAGAFLVAYLDGAPVACGAWRSHGTDGTVAEIKRMYTVPQVRNRGVAGRVLAAVEASARAHGRRRLVLECGLRQPEAIAFYHRSGYERIENFGHYRDSPQCVSFGRDL